MSRLLLHIGAHKTGTTSVQNAFKSREAALAEHCVAYPLTGRLAAEATATFLRTGDATALAGARKAFRKAHGRTFQVLGLMQWFWYRSDRFRERFVLICRDPDVQRLTWQAYMNKELVRRDPLGHLRVFFKDLAHICRLAS